MGRGWTKIYISRNFNKSLDRGRPEAGEDIYISRNFNKSLDVDTINRMLAIYISRNFNKSLDLQIGAPKRTSST